MCQLIKHLILKKKNLLLKQIFFSKNFAMLIDVKIDHRNVEMKTAVLTDTLGIVSLK